MRVTWSFFGPQGKVNTPFFWKLAANEFLLLYFFCSMSGRGEKKVKKGKKKDKNGLFEGFPYSVYSQL